MPATPPPPNVAQMLGQLATRPPVGPLPVTPYANVEPVSPIFMPPPVNAKPPPIVQPKQQQSGFGGGNFTPPGGVSPSAVGRGSPRETGNQPGPQGVFHFGPYVQQTLHNLGVPQDLHAQIMQQIVNPRWSQ